MHVSVESVEIYIYTLYIYVYKCPLTVRSPTDHPRKMPYFSKQPSFLPRKTLHTSEIFTWITDMAPENRAPLEARRFRTWKPSFFLGTNCSFQGGYPYFRNTCSNFTFHDAKWGVHDVKFDPR